MASQSRLIRRSPRSIERFCEGIIPPGFTPQQSAVLLALAHCSSWSADRIAHTIETITGITLSAEQVFNFHWSWTIRRGEHLSTDDFEIAQIVLSGIGFNLLQRGGRPLSHTRYPTTIKFADSWSPNNVEDEPLFHGYTKPVRDVSKTFLAQHWLPAFGRLTPIEEALTHNFGGTIIDMLKDSLRKWARDVRVELLEFPGPRPIRQKFHVNMIINYLNAFEAEYQQNFGMGDTELRTGPLGQIKNNTVFIKDTASGVKVFLGLMMADRLYVVDQKRREERVRIGFEELENLTEDSKNCSICGDELGAQNPEGIVETPLKITICCGQIMGNNCLKNWVNQPVNGAQALQNSCPGCRFEFPKTFIEKLLTAEEYQRRVNHVFHPPYEAMLLVNTTPSPILPRARRQIPIDFGVFEEDARLQVELRRQRETAPEPDVGMESEAPMLPPAINMARRRDSIDIDDSEEVSKLEQELEDQRDVEMEG